MSKWSFSVADCALEGVWTNWEVIVDKLQLVMTLLKKSNPEVSGKLSLLEERNLMRNFLFLVVVVICAVTPIFAQTELSLKQYFEGKYVTLIIDMPASKDGVNVYPERAQALDYSEYANRLKKYGTSVRRGEEIMITKIKAKDKHIEFQLGGGGYGTIGDETDSSAYVSTVGKSRREKNLEDELKNENDPKRRKRMKEEIDDLRHRREREDERNRAIAAEASEAKRARIEQKALQAGSRFNVHFRVIDARVLRPEALVEALRKYVDFSDAPQKSYSFR